MEDTGTGDFAEDAAGVARQTFSQFGASLPIEGAFGVEKVGTIENPADHVPFREPEGVVSDRVEHTTVDLALGLCMSRACGTVPQRGRARSTGGPLRELLGRGISQGIVQPHRSKPAVALGIRHPHLLRPLRRQLCHLLDVLEPFGCDDGPFG